MRSNDLVRLLTRMPTLSLRPSPGPTGMDNRLMVTHNRLVTGGVLPAVSDLRHPVCNRGWAWAWAWEWAWARDLGAFRGCWAGRQCPRGLLLHPPPLHRLLSRLDRGLPRSSWCLSRCPATTFL